MNRAKRRPTSIRYTILCIPLFFCVSLLVLFLLLQLLNEQKKEQESVLMTAALPSGTITEELFQTIQDYPGLLCCWAVYAAPARIRIGSYQTSAEIWGIDLSAWPLRITSSAGKKPLGRAPLLVAGQDFFQGMTDGSGAQITRRQARVFEETMGTLEVEITFSQDVSDERSTDFSAGNQERPLRASTAPSSVSPSSCMGGFLALTEGSRLYMDAVQMKEVLKDAQIFSGLSRVCLEIQGKKQAKAVEKSLTKAGFLVENFSFTSEEREAIKKDA